MSERVLTVLLTPWQAVTAATALWVATLMYGPWWDGQ